MAVPKKRKSKQKTALKKYFWKKGALTWKKRALNIGRNLIKAF